MGSKKDHRENRGYLGTYELALSSIAEAKQEACVRLGEEWSEAGGKLKKRRCPRCHRWVAVNTQHVLRTVRTRIGAVRYRRHYYYCHGWGQGWYPRDEELKLTQEDMTEDVVELALDFAVNDSFQLAAERLELHHAIQISPTGLKLLFERQSKPLADREIPKPVVSLAMSEHNGHRPVVIMNDGSMLRHKDGWHEAKLLSVEILGETNRVYLAETRDKDRFERQLFESEGFSKLRSRTGLWIADGAPFNWGLQGRLCPHAQGLVDYWHVKEHLHECAVELFGEGDGCVELFVERGAKRLLASEGVKLIGELKGCHLQSAARTKQGKRQGEALESLWE